LAAYILRRLILGIIVLFLVTIMVFILIFSVPGDPVRAMLGIDASQEQVDALTKKLWLDRPMVVQYGHWLYQTLQGDLGESIMYMQSVTSLLALRLPITLQLSLEALFISVILGIGAGIICAVRRGSWLDQIVTLLANIGVAIPIFWLGVLGIYLFALKLNWFPLTGFVSPAQDLWGNFRGTVLPIICLAVPGIAVMARQTRSSMLEVIRQDYVRTAWSKGLRERAVVFRHSLKNALIPVITLLGLYLGTMVGGSVLVESVFNIPGMGRLLVESAMTKDFIVVQACALIIGSVVVLANLLVDISYGWLDRRIQYE
jgi:peptide/nickel transport system permease protein